MATVLIADDHAQTRMSLRLLVETMADSRVVGLAVDGVEAVELARKLHPDVVLMDIGMPRMNGVEATRQIKAEFPQMRVIGISMWSNKSIHATIRASGADESFDKSETGAILAAIRTSDG